MEALKGFLMFGGVGLFIIAFGVTSKRGYARMRPLYMKIINPLVAPVDGVYAAFPLGLGFMLVGIGLVLDSAILAGIGLGGGTILGFVFIAWKPRWMKPDWLLWLEEHYDQFTIDYMFAQVRRDKSHFKKVRSCTQEELYAWAEEMARKHEQLVKDPHTIWEQHL